MNSIDGNNEIILCNFAAGIRVQLDAIVNLKFDTKVDNRLSNHKKIEGILQDALEPAEGYYIASPVLEDLSNGKIFHEPTNI